MRSDYSVMKMNEAVSDFIPATLPVGNSRAYGQMAFPLTPLQTGMLYNALSQPGTGVDIAQLVCTLQHEVDVSALIEAWQRVMERHQTLRTHFQWKDLAEPVQVVQSAGTIPSINLDWSGLTEQEQEAHLKAFLQQDRLNVFDLEAAPLMRLACFRLSSDQYKLVWTFHHIILDGRSIRLVLNEVFNYYEALIDHTEPCLQDQTPYASFLEWVGKQDLSASESYWRRALKGFTTPNRVDISPIPGSALPHEPTYDKTEIVISSDFTSSLRRYARLHQVTVNNLVQGAWALLLSRYTGDDDILFGAVRACRHSTVPHAENIVGFFINTLPMRVAVDPQQSVQTFLRGLWAQQVALRAVEHTPLTKIREWCDIAGNAPLFESIVIFENYNLETALRNQGGKWSDREFKLNEQTGFPLTLNAYLDESLILRLMFNRNRFDEAMISRMLGHLEVLLQQIIAFPDSPIAQLSMLTEAERQQLLVEWNRTEWDYPRDTCLHTLFEAQVQRTPHAVAVVFEQQQLTYQELDIRANQLAHHLQGLGVGPETLVGLCVERSLEVVIGLLGILKAGGAYVPLDPTHPSDRLGFVLEDAKVPVLLTQSSLLHRLPKSRAQWVCLDTDWKEIAMQQTEAPVSAVVSENLAYVIYTSGSTGKPKGVCIEHRSVGNILAYMRRELQVTHADRFLAVTTLSFDIATLEMFLPLTSGACLLVASQETAHDGMLLGQHLITSVATILQATPATWRMLQSDPQPVQGLKALCGGEALAGDLAEALLDQGYELWNVYGPTETTIWSTCCRVEHNPITIGHPIDNTQVYVLDRTMAPVPVGVPGELYIGGDGLARGYLNRPELTAEKFITDPFRSCPGARLYRTGDRVRYRPDGRLEYLERIDHQVKIRGFRIELGEIEAVLRALPEVAEVVVVAREDVPGDKRLVAYLVSQGGAVSPGDLRNHLRRNLPEYMVPSAFVFLEALPLTPNGKVDRGALPVPEGSGYEEAYVVPRNPMEEGLAEIWREVLQLEQVGVHDSFFDLGGHSLLAVRLFARIEQRFGTRLPLSTLFHSPTITHLASLLHSEAPDSLWSSLVAIQPYGDKPPFFCVHAIGANLLNYRLLAYHLGADQPFYGFQAQGLDGEAKMHSSVEEMAAHYISEMRTVKPFGPYRLGGGSAGGVIAFEMARQLKLRGEEVDLLALIDTSCPSSQGRLPQSFRTRILTGLDLRWGSLLNHQGNLYAFLIEWIREYARVLTHRTLAKPGRVGDEELAPNIRRVVQAGRQVLDAYNPSPYPGRITLFLVRIDPQRTAFDTRLQWGELVHGGMEVAFIDGDHTTMMEEPFVRNLATKLQACLNRTAGTVPPPFS